MTRDGLILIAVIVIGFIIHPAIGVATILAFAAAIGLAYYITS